MSLVSWAGLGMVFAYFVLPTLLSVGAGLGNRATHVWHSTRFRSCGLGSGGSRRIPCYFFSHLPIPPAARELGALWITLTTPTCTGEQDRLVFVLTFRFSVDTFSPYPRCGWHGDGFR